jgi:hypothetical protein
MEASNKTQSERTPGCFVEANRWARSPGLLSRRCKVKSRTPLIVLTVLTLTRFALEAQAGLIRSTGNEISKGSARVVSAAASGGAAAVGGVAAAGTATGSVVKAGAADAAAVGAAAGSAAKTGTVDVARGARATPGAVGRATRTAARGIWKAIW